MMSAFSVTGGRLKFPTDGMYSKTLTSFLMTFMGAGRILAYKPICIFFTFPWILTNCHLASFTLCRACLINVKNLNNYAHPTSQNQVNHPRRTPLCACLPSLYLQKFFLFDDCFSIWLLRSWPGVFLSVCLQQNSSDNKYTSALCLSAHSSTTCSGSG